MPGARARFAAPAAWQNLGVERARAAVGVARPTARTLLPQWVARLVSLAALGLIGALEWRRMIAGLGVGRPVLWVLVACGVALALLAADRSQGLRRRRVALALVVVGGLLAGYIASGTSLAWLKPHRWDDLLGGLGGGTRALGTVRLPYNAADPWPAIALRLLGAQLLVLAGLLTFWPRPPHAADAAAPASAAAALAPRYGAVASVRDEDRAARRGGDGARGRAGVGFAARRGGAEPAARRGFPVPALCLLLVLAASPVISIGGGPARLGLMLALLTVCFLWLERLPLRPGVGVLALVLVALVGSLPLTSLLQRDQPWFDYRAFAESLGPDDPVRFDWTQGYGPIDWPRDGNEVMRVQSAVPLYWKAQDLDVFDGQGWEQRVNPQPTVHRQPWAGDLSDVWRQQSQWTYPVQVTIQRMRTSQIIGAGTTLSVSNASQPVTPGISAGTWNATTPLRRGDSYSLSVHVPQPSPQQLARAATGDDIHTAADLRVTVPIEADKIVPPHAPGGRVADRVHAATAVFAGWSTTGGSYAIFPQQYQADHYDIAHVMNLTPYARTWKLAQRLRKQADTPYGYVEAVESYLAGPRFRYSERPPATPAGQAPLDFFLNVSHAGYCQHYAGAMALLLRMGGVPARVVTGFSPGGYSKRYKAWIVRDTDAHAWVEAWFDRYGWVTFDPTPTASPARSQIATLAQQRASAPSPPQPGAAPTPVPGGDGGTAIDTGKTSVPPELRVGARETAANVGVVAGGRSHAWVWIVLGALAALALAALAVALARRPRGAIAELEDALRRVGRPVATGTTLHELERRLGSHSPEAAGYLRALSASRYATSAPRPTRAGRRAVRRALASGLGPIGQLRALWALPPRLRPATRG